MKQKLLFFCLLWLTVLCLPAQNAYYDAVKLSRLSPYINEEDDTVRFEIGPHLEAAEIVRNYVTLTADNSSYSDIQEALQGNPFIALPADASASVLDFGPLGSLANIPGMDVTNLSNALADVMISRAKQELTVSFFNQFRKTLEKYPEIQVLFPKTSDKISNLLSEKYTEMLPALRRCFHEDLERLPLNLPQMFELPRYNRLWETYPEIKILIRSLSLIQELENNVHPAQILEDLAAFKEWDKPSGQVEFRNFGTSVKLAALFSHSLRADSSGTDTNAAWISLKQFKDLAKDETAFRIYLGLLYQEVKMKEIVFYRKSGQELPFTTLMKDNADNIFLFETRLRTFISLAERLESQVRDTRRKKQAGIALSNEDYYNYIGLSIDVVEYGFDIARMFDTSLVVTDYLELARKSNELYKNVFQKEYSLAVYNAVDILERILEMTGKTNVSLDLLGLQNISARSDLSADYRAAVSSLATELQKEKKALMLPEPTLNVLKTAAPASDKIVIEAALNTLQRKISLDKFREMGRITARVAKYGLFMANVVEAKSAQDMKAVIENAILPVGSSSIKKNAWFNVSIQSYLGAFYQPVPRNDLGYAWNDKFGVTAPIGISFNYGMRRAGSIGLFAPLFDIGAIVDYRLKANTQIDDQGQSNVVIEKDYKVKLGQIFSPGAYLVYGFPCNIPLALGAGGQYGPGLGKIDAGQTVLGNPSWRWNIFLTVDIPFFTVYNRPKSLRRK